MAIKDIVARGIGFSPGSVEYIVTHGLTAGEEATIDIVVGKAYPVEIMERPDQLWRSTFIIFTGDGIDPTLLQ